MEFYKENTKEFLLITNIILFILAWILTVISGEYIGHDVFKASYEKLSIIACCAHLVILFLQGIYVLAKSKL